MRRHRHLTAAIAAAGLAGLLGLGAAVGPLVEAAPSAVSDEPASAVEAPATGVCSLFEDDVVLELVREHRRGTADETRRALARAIVEQSRSAGLDPLLVASIVASESSFRARAVSRVGAVGLMQIRPFVARDVADRADLPWDGRATLESPEANLRLGIGYYRELLERFDGDDELALTAYNRGPTRVRRTLRDGTYRASSYAATILARYGALAGARPADPLEDCAGA